MVSVFTGSGAAAARAGGLDPLGVAGQRAFRRPGGSKVGNFRQAQRQLAFGMGCQPHFSQCTIWGWARPSNAGGWNTQSRNEVDLLAALWFLQPGIHLFGGIFNGQTGQEAGVDQRAGGNIGKGSLIQVGRGIALDDFDNGQAELLGELQSRLSWAGTAMILFRCRKSPEHSQR